MILLNYAHPLTDAMLAEVATHLGAVPEIRMLPSQTERERPLAEVAIALADAAMLTPLEWQTVPLVVNPPSLAPFSIALLAELHGRMGHFPTILNIRPVKDSLPTRYELGEIVNLDGIREHARTRRGE